jgi:DNA-binding transcriptional MerR regulator
MPEGGYSSTQVCSITQVPYGTLFEWMSTGLITPSLIKPQGRGKHARWSFRDIVAVRAIQSLRRHASLQAIRKAVDYIQHQMDIESPLSERWLATDGEEIYTLDSLDGGRLLALARRQGQMTSLICVELKSSTEELRTMLEPVDLHEEHEPFTRKKTTAQRRKSA